ncbi:hypothetical protein ABQF34_14105 [Mycolicibacterium boenickei]
MKTVLGLSVAPHGIAWALVAGGRSGDVSTLDDDAFEVELADQVAARAAAAARSAQAIAASSGQDVAAIGVTWSGPDSDDDQLAQLLERLTTAGFDDVRVVDGTEALQAQEQLRAARDAAEAVATNAVPPTPAPVRNRRPAPRKHRAVRVVAATAAAVAAGLLTVGSQFTEPAPIPDTEEGELTAAAAPQLVTVATQNESERAVMTPPAEDIEEPVPMQVAERAERAPVAEAAPVAEPAEPAQAVQPVVPTQRVQPVTAVETTAPQAVPVTHAANPAPQHMPVGLNAPGPVPVAAGIPGTVPSAPAPPVPQPAAPPPPVAPEPAPFAPKPGSDLWLLNALP